MFVCLLAMLVSWNATVWLDECSGSKTSQHYKVIQLREMLFYFEPCAVRPKKWWINPWFSFTCSWHMRNSSCNLGAVESSLLASAPPCAIRNVTQRGLNLVENGLRSRGVCGLAYSRVCVLFPGLKRKPQTPGIAFVFHQTSLWCRRTSAMHAFRFRTPKLEKKKQLGAQRRSCN